MATSWKRWFMVQVAKAFAGPTAPGAPRGESTLVTRHAVYVLRDGACVDVCAPDGGPHEGAPTLLGMQLVGFVAAAGDALSTRWRMGDHAVLLRRSAAADVGPTVAITSRSRFLVAGRLAVAEAAPSAPTLRVSRAPVRPG